jgi:DNA-binding CsgD family transcriptional regulator
VEHFAATDLLAIDTLRRPEGTVYHDHMYPDQSELLMSVAHHEFQARHRTERLVGCLLQKARDRGVLICVRRGDAIGPFTAEEQERFARLLPHIKRALQIHRQLARQNLGDALLSEVLNRVQFSVFVTDERREVIHANAAAEALLRLCDGLAHHGRRLLLSNQSADRQLDLLLSDAVRPDGKGGVIAASRPSGGRDFRIMVAPLVARESDILASARRFAIVFVSDPDAPLAMPAGILESMYGLTRTAARIALKLGSNMSVKGAAQSFGITHNTLRSHLQHIFSKLRISRQTELNRLLSKLTMVSPDSGS